VRKETFSPVASRGEHGGRNSQTEQFDSIDALVQTGCGYFEEFPGLRFKGNIVLFLFLVTDELVNEDTEGDGNSNEEGEGQTEKDPNSPPVAGLQNGFFPFALGFRMILLVGIVVGSNKGSI
jgi:hypothetical protein